MSRTTHIFKGVSSQAKTRKKSKDKKNFGFTDGVHSKFEPVTLAVDDRNDYLTDIMLYTDKTIEREVIQKTYPEKNIDYVKYGYGNGTKKQNRIKNYKREIE